VDGVTRGNCSQYATDGCALTSGADNNPFWILDLGSTATVTEVVIYNRVDESWGRLSDLQIRLGNVPPRPLLSGAMIAANQLCAMLPGTPRQRDGVQVRAGVIVKPLRVCGWRAGVCGQWGVAGWGGVRCPLMAVFRRLIISKSGQACQAT